MITEDQKEFFLMIHGWNSRLSHKDNPVYKGKIVWQSPDSTPSIRFMSRKHGRPFLFTDEAYDKLQNELNNGTNNEYNSRDVHTQL